MSDGLKRNTEGAPKAMNLWGYGVHDFPEGFGAGKRTACGIVVQPGRFGEWTTETLDGYPCRNCARARPPTPNDAP